MGVVIEQIRYYSEFDEITPIQWALLNVGDYYRLEIDFRVETFFITETDVSLGVQFAPPTQLTNDYIEDVSGTGRFADFHLDSTFSVTGSQSGNDNTYLVQEKVNDNLIRVDASLINEVTSYNVTFELLDYISGIKFSQNLIPKNSVTSFADLTTGQTRALITDSANSQSAVEVPLIPTNGPEWEVSNEDVGLGLTNNYIKGRVIPGKQAFTIVYSGLVTPLYRDGELENLASVIQPDEFFGGNSLKPVYQIDAAVSLSDPNRLQTVVVDEFDGNIGWYNEVFNSGNSNYSVENVGYKDAVTNASLNEIDFNNENDIVLSFELVNTVDSPFVTGQKFRTYFIYLPTQDDYTNTGRTYEENFFLNKCFTEIDADKGVLAATEDSYILEGANTILISPDRIKVEVNIRPSASALERIKSLSSTDYLFYVSYQPPGAATSPNRATTIVDVNKFVFNLENPSVISGTTSFFSHEQNNINDSGVRKLFCTEDAILAKTKFSFDRTNGELLRTITPIVYAVNNVTGESFEMKRYTFDASASVISGGAQNIDVSQVNAYNLPSTDVRKNIRLFRDFDGDDALNSIYAYILQFPFAVRWEYWKELLTVNDAFFDNSLPNDGKNHEWYRYDDLSNWQIKYKVDFLISVGDQEYTKTIDTPINSLGMLDYESNPNWSSYTVRTYDPDTLTELVDGGGNALFYNDEDTRVEVTISQIALQSLGVNDVSMEIRMEVFEEGGEDGIWRLSNVHNYESSSNFLKSLDGSGLVELTEQSGVFKGVCFVNFSAIPKDKLNFKISARLEVN